MGIGTARRADRAVKAAELAVSSPLLETSIDGAHGVLISIQGGSDLGLQEISQATQLVQEVVHPEANIIFGTVIDDAFGDEVRVTVIAAGFDPEVEAAQVAGSRGEHAAIPSPSSEEKPAERPATPVETSSESRAEAAADPYATQAISLEALDQQELDIPDFLK